MKNYRTNTALLSGILILFTSLSLISCKKKTPPNPNEEELITTLRIQLTDSAGVQPSVVAMYKDTDGDGGNAPSVWDTIRIKENTTYYATILLLDESKTPADTISHEVAYEAQDHLFCFTVNSANCVIKRTDLDVNGLELGLQSKWTTGSSSQGSVQIVLRHQPDVKTGSCAPGDTDIDLVFPCLVE